MPRQNGPILVSTPGERGTRELRAGSELLIAFTLGMAGWWAILHTVFWIAG